MALGVAIVWVGWRILGTSRRRCAYWTILRLHGRRNAWAISQDSELYIVATPVNRLWLDSLMTKYNLFHPRRASLFSVSIIAGTKSRSLLMPCKTRSARTMSAQISGSQGVLCRVASARQEAR